MLKKTAEASTRTSLETKCGDCLHHQGVPHFDKPCAANGVKKFAKPCDAFFPNVPSLTRMECDTIKTIGDVLNNCDGSQSRVISVLLARGDWFRKAKVQFGQMVVFCMGTDYLSNYVRGYVIGVTRDGEEVFISSSLENLNGKKNAMIRLMRDSVLTLDEFESRRKQLIRNNQVVEVGRSAKPSTLDVMRMPAKQLAEYRRALTEKPNEYVPPSMETVPSHWFDNRPSVPTPRKGKATVAVDGVDERKPRKPKAGSIRINRGAAR